MSSNVYIVTPEANYNYMQTAISEVQSLTSSSEDIEPSTNAAPTTVKEDFKLVNFLEPPSPTDASSKQDETTKVKTESDVLDLDDFIANVLKRTTEAPKTTPSVQLSSTTVSLPIEDSSSAQGKSLQETPSLSVIVLSSSTSTSEEETSTTQSSTTSTAQSSTTTTTTTEKSREQYNTSSDEGSSSDSFEYSEELNENTSSEEQKSTTKTASESTSQATIVSTFDSTTAEATSQATTDSLIASIALSSTNTDSSETTIEPTIETTIMPELNQESFTEITSEYKNFTISFQQGSATPRAIDDEEKSQPKKRSISERSAIPYILKAMKQTGSTECIFSGKTYKAGEKIKTDDDCLKCFCEIPPIGQCFQKDNCYQLIN